MSLITASMAGKITDGVITGSLGGKITHQAMWLFYD